jgi:glycosyltransferase involved in cell wall biosynthesis
MIGLQKRVISVLLPVMNEVHSLTKTVEIILEQNPNINFEFIIILSPRSTEPAVLNSKSLQASGLGNCSVIVQKYPGLGGAYAHGIEVASGDHILMIASDLETDPNLVKKMISESQQFPESIITTTRWVGDSSGFASYGRIKKALNYVFQKWISFLYRTDLTDYTFGFRLYPSQALTKVRWQTTNFAFLLESILVPLKRGFRAIEIPHYWRPREEGDSNNKLSYFVDYFRIALQIRKLP